MGSKPKKQDYKPSAAEQASAAVAKAEYDYFKQNYEPLLLEMRDKAQNENFRDSIRGRASADVAQALSSAYTGAAKAWSVTDVGTYEDIGKAWIGQVTSADAAALDVKNTLSTGVLGTARKQAAEAQSGMAQASRLATSEALTKAKANQQVAESKFNAGVMLAGATIMGAADKYARKSGQKTQGAILGDYGMSPLSPNYMEHSQMSYVQSKSPLQRSQNQQLPSYLQGSG